MCLDTIQCFSIQNILRQVVLLEVAVACIQTSTSQLSNMFPRMSLIISVLVALLCSISVVAAPPNLEQRSGNVCSSGIYGELAPLLKGYAPAVQYCSAHYPLTCTTAHKRQNIVRQATTPRPTPTVTTTTTTTTTPKTTTTTSKDTKASAWSKCQGQGGGVVSTMCSCINGPATVSRIPCS